MSHNMLCYVWGNVVCYNLFTFTYFRKESFLVVMKYRDERWPGSTRAEPMCLVTCLANTYLVLRWANSRTEYLNSQARMLEMLNSDHLRKESDLFALA